MTHWKSTATIETLKTRARIIQTIRTFFHARQVWEVETPLLSHSGNPDPNINSFLVHGYELDEPGYLHTSPEFAMKRLLACGSGAIYQLCKVFRAGEIGRNHNPEFSMLEWYRPGYDYQQLMQEVDALLRTVLDEHINLEDSQYLSYKELFQQYAGIDPFTAGIEALKLLITHAKIEVEGMDKASADDWLNLILTHIIEPALPRNCPVFIYDFPETQASLAKIRNNDPADLADADPANPPVAERFELYLNGVELANGFSELTDATEQRSRFEKDNLQRKEMGKDTIKLDQNLLQALQTGLPESAGVAVGIDRLVMLATQASSVSEVIAFDYPHS
jgi:lysyl-tRNA synthetase class 2